MVGGPRGLAGFPPLPLPGAVYRHERLTYPKGSSAEHGNSNLDWSQCPAVESIPGKVSGAWLFKDTRMPVSIVLENFESGATIDEIMEWFDVTHERVVALLEFAARSLDAPPTVKESARMVDANTL